MTFSAALRHIQNRVASCVLLQYVIELKIMEASSAGGVGWEQLVKGAISDAEATADIEEKVVAEKHSLILNQVRDEEEG